MFDVKLFGYAPFASSILANFLSIVGLIGFIFFVSQHLQLVLGLSPLAAGLVTLPGAAAVDGRGHRSGAPGQVVRSATSDHHRAGAGLGGLRDDPAVPTRPDRGRGVASFIVLEIGVGISQTITNDTIVSSVPAAKSGAASAVSETAYELGAVIGTAILGTIFTAFYRTNVATAAGPFHATGSRRRGEHRRRDGRRTHAARRARRTAARLGAHRVRLGHRADGDHRRGAHTGRCCRGRVCVQERLQADQHQHRTHQRRHGPNVVPGRPRHQVGLPVAPARRPWTARSDRARRVDCSAGR